MTKADSAKQADDLPMLLGRFPLEWLLRNERWQAVMIPGLEPPLPQPAVHALQRMLIRLDDLLADNPALQSETLLQFSQLHVGGCAKLMSARASYWQPRLGLGVFPDQPPPELWGAKDFEVLPGTKSKIRPLMNTVMRVASSKGVQDEVAAECLISGGVMRFYTEDFSSFLSKSKEFLLPRLSGSAFQGHRFYLPMLNASSFRGSRDEDLDRWLPNVTACIAQTPSEQGLVLALRGDLAYLLRQLNKELQSEEIKENG